MKRKKKIQYSVLSDAHGVRMHVVPEGIVVETSRGEISLLTAHIDDRSLLEANRDRVAGYEDIQTIIETIDRAANDGRWWLVA